MGDSRFAVLATEACSTGVVWVFAEGRTVTQADSFSSAASGCGMPFEMRHSAAWIRSAMRFGKGSGHPETACGLTPHARAAAEFVPPSRLIASVLSIPALKHSFSLNASILPKAEGKLAYMSTTTYGQRLAEALKVATRTRASLALELKISVQAVGQCITGATGAFTSANNAAAAKYLKVNPHWLATGQGKHGYPYDLDAPPVAAAFADRLEVSESDWAKLEAVKHVLTETQIEEILRKHAEFKALVEQEVKARMEASKGVRGDSFFANLDGLPQAAPKKRGAK